MIEDMGLQKVYVITEISAAPDGSPYVLLSLKGPDEVTRSQPPTVTSSEFRASSDIFRNLGNVLSRQMMGGFTTVIKMGLNEYDTLNIRVGDRISLYIEKKHVGIP